MKVEVASYSNTFFEYLRLFIWFSQDRLTAMMERYSIGATDQGDSSTGHPIFWHINVAHLITNGHIITMDNKTGKVYDNSWYYQDKQPTCLFGEHLLLDFPDKTVALFQSPDNRLDDFTYNKSIQKACESFRISKEQKDFLRTLRR